MPIPIMLGVAAAATGAFGIKKGADAVSDTKEAKRLIAEAKRNFESAKEEMEFARKETQNSLEKLGKLKLEVMDRQFSRFVNLFSKVRNIEIESEEQIDGLNTSKFTGKKLKELKNSSVKASELLSGGAKVLSSGTLVGVAGYGGAMLVGTASTGTAISSLSGAAATKATLAWLGGGSIATGGFGVAGGVAILGGLVAGPALAVGGMIFSGKAREKLAEAKKKSAEARKNAENMRAATSILKAIKKVSQQFINAILQIDTNMTLVLDNLEKVLQDVEGRRSQSIVFRFKKMIYDFLNKEVKFDYDKLNQEERKTLMLGYNFAEATKILIETKILNDEGTIAENYEKALKPAQKLIGHTQNYLKEA